MFTVKNLSLNYSSSKGKTINILSCLNFSLPNKGLVFIVGKSGCGKSSLLSLLAGINTPSNGEIYYKNQCINDLNNELKTDYHSKIGILFQDYNLILDLTVYENIILNAVSKDNRRIDSLLEKYNLSHTKNIKVFKLSGGEKQRVALVRSLINDPEVIFADEPTGALDAYNSKILMDELYEQSKTKLVICVTHNEDYLKEYNSYFIRLKNGKIEDKFLPIETEEKPSCDFKKKRSNYKNILLIFKNLYKKTLKTNILSILILTFSLISIIFSFNFKLCFEKFTDTIHESYTDHNVFEISKIDKKGNGNSSFSIVKKELPEKEQLMTLFENSGFEYYFRDNLKYFIQNNTTYFDKLELGNLQFYPLFFATLENNVKVNKAFIEKYELNIGDEIVVIIDKSYNVYIPEKDEYFKEELSYQIDFVISDIVQEFEFLETPKIYYSYEYLYKILTTTKSPIYSKISGKNKNLLDFLFLNDSFSDVRSYSYLINISDENLANFLRFSESESFKNLNFSINQDSYTIYSSYKNLSDTLILSMNFFVITIFIVSLCSIAFLNLSLLIEKRKENAILSILSKTTYEIFSPFILKELLNFTAGFLISAVLLNYLKDLIMDKINNLIALNLSLKIDIKYTLLIFLILLMINIFIGLIPILKEKKIDVYKELREE